MNSEDVLVQFDGWLRSDSDVAALVLRQSLESVEGKDAIIFPPTYARPERMREEDWTGYNIDRFEDGSNVCQLDSVGSQANRMEPIFKRKEYRDLVPRVTIKANLGVGGEQAEIDLLDAGHRAADAIVRFSTLGPSLHEGFRAFNQNGNAEKLARIAPTSIVFGSWDSRSTQAKLPRIVRSIVRAYNVEPVHRSAQYSTIAGEILEDGEAEVTTEGPKAELGFAHVPAVMTHGGIRVKEGSEIRREAVLNLVQLRNLGAESATEEDDLVLRRYILGLALLAFTAPQDTALREGCQLVPDVGRKPEWKEVRSDGTRSDLNLTHAQSLSYARAAAKDFGVASTDLFGDFNGELARKVMSLTKEQRKELLRRGPVTPEALEESFKKTSTKKTTKRSTREED